MKLDRNINKDGRGKYALIKLRQTTVLFQGLGVEVLRDAVDFGNTPVTDFFVIRLKDKFAAPALKAYADAARAEDPEYAAEIDELATLAAENPNKRMPD